MSAPVVRCPKCDSANTEDFDFLDIGPGEFGLCRVPYLCHACGFHWIRYVDLHRGVIVW